MIQLHFTLIILIIDNPIPFSGCVGSRFDEDYIKQGHSGLIQVNMNNNSRAFCIDRGGRLMKQAESLHFRGSNSLPGQCTDQGVGQA